MADLDGKALRRWWPHAVAAAVTLAFGFALGGRFGGRFGEAERRRADGAFHDIRVNLPADYTGLVDPGDPEVAALAARLRSLEEAYLFVRDGIAFDPSAAAGAPAQILAAGRASCLGKATLLVSLYRALGVPAESVRVVTGQVPLGGGLIEHAWVDLEYGGVCIQQDPTDLLGVHAFLRFPDTAYTDAFVQRELFCFNDEEFAAVSQLNRMRARHPRAAGRSGGPLPP